MVTLARSASDTFAGIRPIDTPGFIVAQFAGAAAAAFFNALADAKKARARSAGTKPGARVHPEVVEVMREVGIDLSDRTPRLLTDEVVRDARLLITMGCGDECPVVAGLERDDWPLEDPKRKSIERVREIRDDIKRRVELLVESRGYTRES